MDKTNTGNGKEGRREGDMKLYIVNKENSCWKFTGHHTRIFLINIRRVCVCACVRAGGRALFGSTQYGAYCPEIHYIFCEV
jgi:hypothetical protein